MREKVPLLLVDGRGVERELDWMAKRRMNLLLDMYYFNGFSGDAFEQALPEIGPEVEGKDMFTLAGFPPGWAGPGLPPEDDAGGFPVRPRRGRPFHLHDGLRRGAAAVPQGPPRVQVHARQPVRPVAADRPADPHAYEVEKKYLAKVVELFGTDHLYLYSPYCEIDVGGSAEKNLQMRIQAGRGVMKLIQEADPKGIWVTDTWDILTGGRSTLR